MAGAGQSTIKDLKASIKAGFNPKVSLDPYESERAKKTGPRSLKLKKESVNEANKPDASMVMTDQLKKKMISDKDKNTLGKIANLMANAKNKDKKNAYVRQVGLKAMKAGKVNPARGHSPTRFGREMLKKEDVEQVDEVTKKEAEAALGGPVKEKPKMSPGKQPAGYRYVRGLARKAMKAGMKKEEVEQIDEISPGLARKAAAASQVKAIEFSGYSGLANLYDKKGKKEGDRLDRKSDKAMDYIEKRQGQKGVDKVNRMVTRVVGEEAEQIDELKKSTLKSYVKKASGEMKKAHDYHQMRYGGRDGTDQNYMKNVYPKAIAKYDRRDAGVEKAKQKLAKEEAEQVTEAEGTVAVTPKEKSLAAHHGDPKKITYGDVIKARLKSAAAKKMGK